MTTIREAYDEFSALIARQERTREALRAERRALQKDIGKHACDLEAGVRKALPSLDTRLIAQLDESSVTAQEARNFTKMTQDMTQADSVTQAAQKSWIEKNGSPETVQKRKSQIESDISGLQRTSAESAQNVRDLQSDLAPINRFNENSRYTITINSKTIPDFLEFSFWRYCTEPAYRAGREIVKEYTAAGGNLARDTGKLAENSAKLQKAKQRIEDLNFTLRNVNESISAIEKLNSSYKGPHKILSLLWASVVDLATRNEAFAASISKTLESPEISLSALKIRNLATAMQKLEQQEEAINHTLRNLNDGHGKLSKGVYRAGYKDISLDLGKIRQSVNAQTILGTHAAQNAARFRTATNDYSPAASDDSFFWQNMFLIYMLTNTQTDAGYIQQTIGVDQKALDEAGLKAEDLKPDLSSLGDSGTGTLTGISAQDLQQATQQIETSFSMPDLELDKLHMPAIEIPTVDIYVPDTSYSAPDCSPSPDCGGGGDGGGGGGGD